MHTVSYSVLNIKQRSYMILDIFLYVIRFLLMWFALNAVYYIAGARLGVLNTISKKECIIVAISTLIIVIVGHINWYMDGRIF